MRKITVHMIGNAHIDPIWLWRWQEGFAEVLATCRSALDRMNETPEFVFSRSSSATYRWIEESAPKMFEEIRRRVAEGRWIIVNGWVEQPDCNIPSGESFVRHALYGKRYFLDKFGVDVKTGWNLDSFGHSGGLPQILSKAGFDCYVFMRPGPDEKELPEPIFWWEGPDGSRILSVRLHEAYGTGGDEVRDHILSCVEWIPKDLTNSLCFYGVGNHGGGPTKRNIESIKAIGSEADGPKTKFSTVREFLDAALAERNDWPVVRDDLQHHAVGCYTSHAGVKTGNRRAEILLGAAERFGAIASREAGLLYPAEDFRKAWELTLFCQFHDSLAGSSTFEAYEDVRDAHGFAGWIAADHLNTTLQSLAQQIDTAGEGAPIVVFNPLPWPVKQPVEYVSHADTLADETGKSVPTQPDAIKPIQSRFNPLRVFVADLPPLGWRVYQAGGTPTGDISGGLLSSDDDSIENDWWRIVFDTTGAISRVYDKQRDVDALSGPVRALAIEDLTDTWSHNVERYDGASHPFVGAGGKLVEAGPVRAAVCSISAFGNSSIRQEVALYRDLDIIECRIAVDWHEKQHLLKLSIPTAVRNPRCKCGASYAWASRDTEGFENPFQQWIDLSGGVGGKSYGVAVLCEGKYGFDVRGSEIRLTLLRSPAYAMHDPMTVEPNKIYRFMDQGLHEITWRLVPHAGDWREAGIPRLAEMLANPAIPVIAFSHPGEFLPTGSFLSVEPRNVILGALKVAEDGDDLVIRLYESEGRDTEARLRIGEANLTAKLGPYEIKTLRLSKDGGTTEVDLIERPV